MFSSLYHSLWRCAVEVEVLEVDHDPLVLERLELVGALLHVALGVQVDRRPEGAVLRRRRRRRDVTLITGCGEIMMRRGKGHHKIISLGLCEGARGLVHLLSLSGIVLLNKGSNFVSSVHAT